MPATNQELSEQLANLIAEVPTEPLTSARPAEVQLGPGIYFTPRPSALGNGNQNQTNTPGVRPPRDVMDMSREDLEAEYREISKSLEKLIESNEEIKKFDPNGEDSELADAILENEDIIVRRRARMQDVKAQLDMIIRSEDRRQRQQSSTQSANTNLATNARQRGQSEQSASTADEGSGSLGLTL